MPTDAVAKTNKFYTLEGIRFLAAFGVLLQHYRFFFLSGEWSAEFDQSFDWARLPFFHFLDIFYRDTFGAVAIFWTLSGFIFAWKYAGAIHRGSVGGRAFFVLRFSRLYPLHIATLLLTLLLLPLYSASHGVNYVYGPNDAWHFVPQLFMASNWFLGQPTTFNGPIWSVSAEIAVYIIFFALARTLRLRLLSCLAIALAFALFAHYDGPWSVLAPVIGCGKYFFMGAATARLHEKFDERKTRIVFVALALTGLAIGAALIFGGLPLPGPSSSLITLSAIAFILIGITAEDLFGHRRFARIAWLGGLTYSTYLIHFPIMLVLVMVADAAGLARQIFAHPAVLLAYLLLVLSLGHLVYRRFELPAQRLIRARFVAPRPAAQMWSARP